MPEQAFPKPRLQGSTGLLKRCPARLAFIKAGFGGKSHSRVNSPSPPPKLKIGASSMRMFKNFPQMLAFATSVLVSAVSAGFAQEGGSPLRCPEVPLDL